MNDLRTILGILFRHRIATAMLALGAALAFWGPDCFQPTLYAVSFSPQRDYRLEYYRPSLYERGRYPGTRNAGIIRLYRTYDDEYSSVSRFLGEKTVVSLEKAYLNPLWHQDVYGKIIAGEAVFETSGECIRPCDTVYPEWMTAPQAAPEVSGAATRTRCVVEGETLQINGACDFVAPKVSCDRKKQAEKEARACRIEALLAHDQAYYSWLSRRLDCAALEANLARSTGRLTRDLAHLHVVKGCAGFRS
jgi:hypothetical protein